MHFCIFLHQTQTKKVSISGTVIDKNLQEPIPYVSVVIKDLNNDIITGGITDDNGEFIIEDIPEGNSNFTFNI